MAGNIIHHHTDPFHHPRHYQDKILNILCFNQQKIKSGNLVFMYSLEGVTNALATYF